MKKLFIILTGFIFCFGSTKAQNSFGFRAAYNNTSVTKASEYNRIASLNRFQIGFYGKHTLYKNWFLKGSVIYNQKGNFYDDTYGIADAGKMVTIKLNYAEASVDAGYGIRLLAKHYINISAGPYIAIGINGTEKGYAETIYGPVRIDKKVDFVNSQTKEGTNLKIKPFDAGLNFNAGYQYKKYGLFINYALGLTNRENFGTLFNRVISVGISYSFK